MSKKQIEKNIELSLELASFLVKNPQKIQNAPEGSSFVVFSASDALLNKLNEKLAVSLKKKGRKVIKAKETKDSSNPWVFTPSFQ